MIKQMQSRSSSHMDRFLSVAVVLIFTGLVLRALADPLLCYDPYAYHMTFAALLWNIGHARELYYVSDVVRPMFEGFGLTAHWLMGLIWKLTGSPNFLPLLNMIPIAIMIWLARRWLGSPIRLLFFALLVMPLLAIHVTSAYIDVFVGAVLVVAWLGLVRLLSMPSSELTSRSAMGARVAFLAGGLLAANAKFTALPVVWAMIAYALMVFIWRRWRAAQAFNVRFCLLLLLMTIVSGATITKNYAIYGNPFHPMLVRDKQGRDIFPGSRSLGAGNPGYFGTGALPNSGYFILSLTEIDWLIRKPPIFYSEASQFSAAAQRYGQGARTGGLFGPFVVLQLLVLAAAVPFLIRKGLCPPVLRHALGAFLLTSFAASLMEQSFELRYWFFCPLMLSVLACTVVAKLCCNRTRVMRAIEFAVLVLLIGVQTMLPLQRTIFPVRLVSYYPSDIVARLRSERIEAFEQRGRSCLHVKNLPIPFPYDYEKVGGCEASYITYTPIYTQREYQLEIPPDMTNCEMLPPIKF